MIEPAIVQPVLVTFDTMLFSQVEHTVFFNTPEAVALFQIEAEKNGWKTEPKPLFVGGSCEQALREVHLEIDVHRKIAIGEPA